MFACRWFEVAVLVSSVAKTAHTSVRQEVPSRDISQIDLELILNAQTSLRRHFIGSLAEVRDRITEVQGFDAVVGGIIQDLQTRNLDPFKLVRYASSSEKSSSPTSLIAEVINNLHGWNSLLQTSGRSELLQKIQELGEPLVDFVLRRIHNHSIKVNSKLLADVLYNFRFREYSPEFFVILESVNQTFFEDVENLSDFHTDAAQVKRPGDVLSDILEFISRKKQPDARLVDLIDQLLSALSDRGNAIQVKNTWELFDLMLQDDYPPDIIQAKNTLSLAVRDNNVGVDLSGVDETIKGNPPMEKLLMLMAKLSGSSLFRREVHAVHPHIKLRHLTSEGQFFRPRTVLDVTFLLDSFLTVRHEMTVLEEVRRIFILSNWEEVLKNFDFARYSKPRPLVVDMIRGLLNESSKLPLCSRIILRYFLSTNRQFCNGDDFREELTGSSVIRSVQHSHPLTPIPHLQVKSLGSVWEASQLPPKLFSATADPSPSAGAITLPSALSTISPDSEGLTELPSSHSASSQPQLSAYSLMTGTSTTPMSHPSVATALPASPTTLPPKGSPSRLALYTTLESSTSAYSQFLPRVVDTTPIDSVDQESPSATIQEQSSTTDPYSMTQDETTSESQLKEKTWQSGVELTSGEPSETTSVDESEITNSTPPGLKDGKTDATL